MLFNKFLKCRYTYKRPFIIDKSLLFYQRLHSVTSKALCFWRLKLQTTYFKLLAYLPSSEACLRLRTIGANHQHKVC